MNILEEKNLTKIIRTLNAAMLLESNLIKLFFHRKKTEQKSKRSYRIKKKSRTPHKIQ
jgi:hypothetical protein